MTLQQLKYAVEIAASGSMNEASKKLFISQPSLSNAIKDLERELGIEIFDRTNRGIIVSLQGAEFLGYARQIVEQTDIIENRYHAEKLKPLHFFVSAQHYAFAADAFVKLVQESNVEDYDLGFKETKTYEIIEDVRTLRSDVGILYINETNSKVLNKLFTEGNLSFTPLFNSSPHIFISKSHPFCNKKNVTLEEIKAFPYVTFEQGDNNSFHFSEEMIKVLSTAKNIKVNDRGTLNDILLGTEAYTIGTGILTTNIDKDGLKALPIESSDIFTVGWIAHKDMKLNKIASRYIHILNDDISENLDLDYCLL